METQRLESNMLRAGIATNEAKKISRCVDKLALNLLELQMINIEFDVGADKINKILPLFFEAKNNLLMKAKQLRAGL